MNDTEKRVISQLFEMQDKEYKDFHAKLIPTVNPDNIIGIRTPQLRKFAANFAKSEEAESFMKSLPHRYYEENNLHGFLIEKIRDHNKLITALDSFLPYVDNWATCDTISPALIKKTPSEFLPYIKRWMRSGHTYTVRFGIEMLMKFFLDEQFSEGYPKLVAEVKSDEYYINMMIAWYFATALAKQYDAVLPYLTEKRLDTWVHNKTIQKAIESYRISKEQKDYLRTLKIR